MLSANDLVMLFLGLETLCVRARGQPPEANRARRAASTSCSAASHRLSSYGVALIYGATGTTRHRGGRRAARRGAASRSTRCCWSASACCSSELRYKIAGSTIPVLGARRVPGRADAGHRVHGLGGEGGGSRLIRRRSSRSRAGRTSWRPAIWALAVLSLVVGRRRHVDRRPSGCSFTLGRPHQLHPHRRRGHGPRRQPAPRRRDLLGDAVPAAVLRAGDWLVRRRVARVTHGDGFTATGRCWPWR